jgi:hypothetical protein
MKKGIIYQSYFLAQELTEILGLSVAPRLVSGTARGRGAVRCATPTPAARERSVRPAQM